MTLQKANEMLADHSGPAKNAHVDRFRHLVKNLPMSLSMLLTNLGNQLLIQLHRFEKLGLRNPLLGGVRNVNAAGTDQKRFSPCALESRNVGSESNHCRLKSIER